MIKHVIWDWNGTLLDDLDVSIDAINHLLKEEQLPVIENKEMYQRVFQFPVIEYYKKAGFDFEKRSFDELAKCYMSYYQPNSFCCSLQKNAIKVMRKLKEQGMTQYVLSASKLDFLHQQMNLFDIHNYFHGIYGLDNIHAHSKAELAKKVVNELGLNPKEVVFIGDSVHDAQVADGVESHCILVAQGHEHKEKLLQTNAEVVDDLETCMNYILTMK